MSELPFYLKGNHAPVDREVTEISPPVRGEIPEQLRGLYVRNGPNPTSGDPGHWFAGDGMLHGVRLEAGRADWYRNRWVRTRPFTGDDSPRISETGGVDLTIGVANTNVVGHAGHILALVETSFPHEVTPELETIGTTDFGGRLAAPFSAHPKMCPVTGEMLSFGYNYGPPYVVYHQVSAGGDLVRSEPIDVPGATMVHDFGVTDRNVVFMDLPVVFSAERAQAGGMPYCWSPEYGARLGVMPRSGGNADVKWIEIEPCYVFHPLNMYEEDDRIVMDVARYPELWREDSNRFEPARLTRWTIDADAGVVKEEPLDDRSIEFPRVDPRRAGLRNRYGYAVSTDTRDGVAAEQLVKYDLQEGRSEVHAFGAGRAPGEAVFVPAAADSAEDEGFLMVYVYDAERDSSDFVVLDAANIAAEPLATVELPQRVPAGFHGNWIPDPD